MGIGPSWGVRWIIVALSLGFWGAGAGAAPLPGLNAYAGSQACADCHSERYRGWQASYHSSVVQNPREHQGAILGDFTQPGIGFTPQQIRFTIGSHWYQRYAVELDGELYVLPSVWSVASHRWETQDEWSWRKKPYRFFCVGCHAVRYDPESGAMAEHAVGCEACHGPGRDHVESGGKGQIANPQQWSADARDLLCASCHVRGTDPSGNYHFAVGYVPGRDLTDHFRPHRVRDGETARDAFLRMFREWRARLGEGPPSACAVCGIEKGGQKAATQTVSARCLGCHEYGADLSAHTRHPGNLILECLDCHRQVAGATHASPSDVHFPEHFQVHKEETFQMDLAVACAGCHSQTSVGELNGYLRSWDHSEHTFPD